MFFVKKFIPCLIIAVFVLTSFLACNETVPENNREAEIPDTNLAIEDIPEDRGELDDLGEYDFEGYEFKILNWTSPNQAFLDGRMDFSEETGEIYQDEIYRRNRRLEERFNIKIDVKIYEGAGNAMIRTQLLADGAEFDLYTAHMQVALTFATEGLINDINTLEHIDLSKAYWDDFLNNQLTIANRKYFAVGAFDFTAYDLSYALVVNKQLLQDYGLEDPFKLVKDGDWTIDKFAEMCKAVTSDLDGDGTMTKDDLWGYVARSSDVLPGFWIGAGVKASEHDSEDIPQNMMGTERFINVIEKIFDITWGQNTYYNMFEFDIFTAGKALFNDSSLHRLKYLRSMETDFGILPYPKWDASQDKYYTREAGSAMYFTSIASAKEDIIRTSVVLEGMASDSYATCLPAYYESVLKTKLTRDEESAEIIDLISANKVVDWVDTVWMSDFRDGLLDVMFRSKTNTLVSLNERMSTQYDTKRDQMVEAFLALDY